MIPIEIVQVALAVGIVFSLLIYEKFFKLIPGGVIVPGYLAIAVNEPTVLLFTFVVALITFGIVYGLSNYLVLFGRRKFLITILISFAVGWGVELLSRGGPSEWGLSVPWTGLGVIPASIRIVGYLIPGLIANGFERQGIAKTSFAILIVTMLTYAVLYAIFGVVKL